MLGYSQEDLADAADVSLKTIGRLEAGNRVSSTTLGKVELALGWVPGSLRTILAGGEPTPIPKPEPIPIDPDLQRAKEAYEVWIRKYPQAEADAKLDEYIRLLLAESKRARSGSSDRRDIDQQTTNTFG